VNGKLTGNGRVCATVMKTMLLILMVLMVLASVAMAGDREVHGWKPYENRFGGWKASIPANLYELTFSEKQRLESPGWRHSTSFESKDGSLDPTTLVAKKRSESPRSRRLNCIGCGPIGRRS